MGGGFGPACRCIRAVCRWLFLNDRLWTLFSHLFGEVGLGVRAIARPHPINDPDHPRVSGENLPVNGSLEASKGSSLLARGKPPTVDRRSAAERIIPACARKTRFLICECTTENAQILETSGCGFAVFSGTADKNTSEPVDRACALAQSIEPFQKPVFHKFTESTGPTMASKTLVYSSGSTYFCHMAVRESGC